MLPAAVLDSSCAIALEAAGLLAELTWLFSKVHLPRAVRIELRRPKNARARVKRLQAENAAFISCNEFDDAAVDLMLPESRRRSNRDRGEAEAAQQAATLEALPLVDDRWGRQIAEGMGLEVHGSLWVVQELHTLRLLTAAAARQSLHLMRATG